MERKATKDSSDPGSQMLQEKLSRLTDAHLSKIE